MIRILLMPEKYLRNSLNRLKLFLSSQTKGSLRRGAAALRSSVIGPRARQRDKMEPWMLCHFLLSHPWWCFSKVDDVKSLHQGPENGKKPFAFASMVVVLDRQCQVPSLRASKWKVRFFCSASMVVVLKDRQCQIPSPRASKQKKTFFAFAFLVVSIEDTTTLGYFCNYAIVLQLWNSTAITD